MLNKETFDKFVSEVNKSYQFFRIWVYTNNKCAEHKNDFNDVPADKDSKYTNFWNVTRVSLQQSWMLAVSRLLDDPYCIGDENKEKPRLSVKYILQELNDDDISNKYNDKTANKKFNKFKYSNRDIRDEKLAHLSVDSNAKKLKAGIEDFFDTVDWLIKEIKQSNKELSLCNDADLIHADNLSKKGVDELFENLFKDKN